MTDRQTDRQTDRRTDGQTDGFAIAYSALSMLSRAKNELIAGSRIYDLNKISLQFMPRSSITVRRGSKGDKRSQWEMPFSGVSAPKHLTDFQKDCC